MTSDTTIFMGDIADAEADALCTSTNPRLSLMMGTGAAVRARGGSEVSRACEAIVAAKGPLPAGSAHATTAGQLPHRVVIHCVASNSSHRSSIDIVRLCVRSAIRLAVDASCASMAMPVFATGHANVRFEYAVQAIAEELRSAPFERLVFVISDPDRAAVAQAIIGRVLGAEVRIVKSTRVEAEPASYWD